MQGRVQWITDYYKSSYHIPLDGSSIYRFSCKYFVKRYIYSFKCGKYQHPFLHSIPVLSYFILLDWHIYPSGDIGALPSFPIFDALLDECRLRCPPPPPLLLSKLLQY